MVDKSTAARAILRDLQLQPENDFVLCIGDGKTDEVVFSTLQEVEGSITSTVGKKQTEAKYYLDTVGDVERLLEKLNTDTPQH